MTSTVLVGPGLAAAVADRLEKGHVLAYVHRDYCGMGLRYAEGVFVYGEVEDGGLLVPSAARRQHWVTRSERLEFGSREGFVAWLARQSDESLSGKHLEDTWLHDNQRISIARLREFAASAG